MMSLTLTFFIFALVAALFGFGGIAAATAGMAQFIFYVFLGLLVLSLITGFALRRDKAFKRTL